MKISLYFISFDIIVSILYHILCSFREYSFINCSFMIGMAYLLFGALCYVWEKGFFNIIIFSFNKIKQQLQKSRGILTDEDDITIEEYAHRRNSFKFTYNLLSCGFIISLSTTIISFIAIS